MSRLFAFGLGLSAEALATRIASEGWEIAGTSRDAANIERLGSKGYGVVRFAGEMTDNLSHTLTGSTHLLHSIPPNQDGDPVLRAGTDAIAALRTLEWIGYLSTVGVYGDQEGAWVDEETPVAPNSDRTRARVAAEQAWLEFGDDTGVPVQIFRLAGIYSPGRSAFDKLRKGTARRIVKPGQVFSRIHVDDIVSVLEASIAQPRAGAIYNVADDEPAPPDEVIAYAARLLGVQPPPEVPFEEAELSPMARSFYEGTRRIGNVRIKSELGVSLRYPTYREGLAAILDKELNLELAGAQQRLDRDFQTP